MASQDFQNQIPWIDDSHEVLYLSKLGYFV